MSESQPQEEYWLSGPIAGVPALLQPVAHALLQAQREISEQMDALNEYDLWEQPAGVASPGFHLQHIAGVIDRLLTYAAGNALSMAQLKDLSEEGLADERITVEALLNRLNAQFDTAIAFLKQTDAATLTQVRTVGRKQLPTTLLGLLFHIAEHTMRHTGQLLVTVRVLND